MKNIHVLPTENESRLRYNSFNKVYELCEFPKYHTDIKSTHNIYITFDEEIKEGDWCLDKFNQRWKLEDKKLISFDSEGIKRFSTDNILGHECQKIILTTNQDLIKDGVQAIDDTFLEWFVKNPSCEDVEVLFACRGLNGHTPIGEYKIIIPKEEDFKHELHVMSKEEVLANRSNAYEFIDFDKQETLEEVAEKFAKKFGSEIDSTRYYAFIAGAKWQQERMYTEKEVLNFTQTMIMQYKFGNTNIEQLSLLKETLQTFKNK